MWQADILHMLFLIFTSDQVWLLKCQGSGFHLFIKQLPEMRELGPIKELSKSFKVTWVVSDRSGI